MSIITDIRAALVGLVVGSLIGNRKKVMTRIKGFLKNKKKVRMSLSYLFSIKINNEYLLIKGNRIDQFQPIGGVFHYMKSFEEIKNKWNISDVNNDQFHDKNDLRIFVPGNRVIKIVEWFHSKKNREVTIHREFIEELVDNNILDMEDLKKVDFELKRIEETGIKYSDHFRMDEYNIYEVYDIVFNDLDIEEKILINSKENERFIWCENIDIEATNISINGLDRKIGKHSKYII